MSGSPIESADQADSARSVCYRHPDRETYIRCGRCDRLICPDCMTSASVGFQCPECVKEGQASVRQPRTVFGASAETRRPVVTETLVALCLAGYALQIAIPTFTARFELSGLRIANGEWWRLFTGGFLHGGLMHLAFNMWALLIVGRQLEPQLGRVRFGVLYAVSLLAGSTVSYCFSPAVYLGVGASGAIFGLFGGLIVVARRMNWQLNALIGLVLINFLVPFVVPNVDWRAHVGGLLAGLIVTAAFAYSPPGLRIVIPAVVIAAIVVGCVVAVTARSQEIHNDPRYAIVFQLPDIYLPLDEYRPFP